MPWHDDPGVLHIRSPFDHRLHQVSELCSNVQEQRRQHRNPKYVGLRVWHRKQDARMLYQSLPACEISDLRVFYQQERSRNGARDQRSYCTLPRLAWTDLRSHFVASEESTHIIAEDVTYPDHDEHIKNC